jgi:glutathione peroxidase
MGFYDYSAVRMDGTEVSMGDYKGKVVLVVNTASKCGFTPQFEGLEALYKKYNAQGLEIIGFPCNQFAHQDSGTNEEIHEFCKLNYGVTFTMFEKIEVNGENAHPLYKFLKSQKSSDKGDDIQWNFTKFLIDREGNVVNRFEPATTPEQIDGDIESLLH